MNLKKNILISEELIFALWFWELVLLRPLINEYKNMSFIILVVCTFILIFISILKKIKITKILVFIFFVYLYIWIKYIFNPNEIIKKILYEFTINAVLSSYFFSQIKNIKLVLNYLIILAIISFFISFRDPFNGYYLYYDYMAFGFLFSLPATLFFRVGRKYFKKKYLVLFEIITSYLLCLYSNRSVILSLIFFYFLEAIYIDKKSKSKKILIFFLIFFLILLCLIFFKEIVIYLYKVALERKLNIRILRTFYNYYQQDLNLSSNLDNLTSGRIEIWKNAIKIIKNNLFFGNELGVFETIYGTYSHNFILDILMEFGILGIIIITIIILKSFFNIIKYNYYERIFGIVLLCLWFPRLIFSSTLYSVSYFWLFINFGLYGFKKYNFKLSRKGEK